MSKFRPHKDRKNTLCPWCGCKENTRRYSDHQNHNRRFYRYWGCGSQKTGREPWQSKDCEINVLEVIVSRLEEQVKTQHNIIKTMQDEIKLLKGK